MLTVVLSFTMFFVLLTWLFVYFFTGPTTVIIRDVEMLNQNQPVFVHAAGDDIEAVEHRAVVMGAPTITTR